jgi:hypothetical protein
MKPINFIIFFTVFISLYSLLNYYIFIRGLQAIPHLSVYRVYYVIVFILIALSFIIGRTLENYWLNPVSKAFLWIGSFWLAAMLYFFIGVLVLDLVRLINHFIPIFPKFITDNYEQVKQYIAISFIILVVISLTIGHLNAIAPQVQKINLKIHKKSRGMKSLNVVIASDIHLGSIVGKDRLDQIVSIINKLQPDVVLLPGDIVDEDIKPVIKENIGESLKNIKAKLGVFAVTGNHEYIGGVEDAVKYLTENGVHFLRDESVLLNNTAYVVGREDRSVRRFDGSDRKPLEELMKDVNNNYPVILMDHQPFKLDEAVKSGVDLQLSGHTHHGQIFPLNYITNAVYDVSWGYRLEGNTHFYVSCGVGTWGPPVRLGNRPEIVNIILEFGE